MTVGDFQYFYSYYVGLNEYYNKNIYLLTITQKCKICDELKRIKQLLQLDKYGICK